MSQKEGGKLTVGKQRVAVGVVQSLSGRQPNGSRVAVPQILGTLDLAQVGDLVQGRGSLVLGVAGLTECGQVAKVQGAGNHEATRWQGVGQDTAAAGAVDISAVLLGDTRRGAAALGSDAVEDGDEGARGGSRLEVLDDLGAVGLGGRGRELSQGSAVGESRGLGRLLGAGAVGLDYGALLDKTALDLGSLGAIDRGRDGVAGEGDDASNLGGVGCCVGKDTLGNEVVFLSSRKSVFHGLL